MINMAKRIKAMLFASVMVISTAALSLVPAQQAKADEKVTRPTDVKITVTGKEYKAGGQFVLTPEFTGIADKITYEVYYPNIDYDYVMSRVSQYGYYIPNGNYKYGYYYDYINHRFVYPYYNYKYINKYYPYYEHYNLGSRAFTLTSEELESGVDSTFDIPDYAYGSYTVRVIVENEAGINTATTSIYIKNDSYKNRYNSYYGYWYNRPYYLYD